MDGLLSKTIDPVKACLGDADVTQKEIDEVIMVGGMTRMPKVHDVVKGTSEKKQIKV